MKKTTEDDVSVTLTGFVATCGGEYAVIAEAYPIIGIVIALASICAYIGYKMVKARRH